MTYSLFDLNEHIRRVVALNFGEPVWITAEVAQYGYSRTGHYLDLVQKSADSDSPVAQAKAMMWDGDLRRLRQMPGVNPDALLRSGLQLRLQVRVTFLELYGLKLQVVDLDPAFTFGHLELLRRQNLDILRQAGLLERNRALPIPLVLQRIAVVSSEGAAGFADFQQHLAENAMGYHFDCQLFSTAVQGKNAEREIIAAFAEISQWAAAFDCVVIIRGGGAKLDLAAFDGLELAKAAAHLPLPLLTGIGHETDQSLLDAVAHDALKTPTAVADFLIHHNLGFEQQLAQCARDIHQVTNFQLKTQRFQVEQTETILHFSVRERFRLAAQRLDEAERQLPLLAARFLRTRADELDRCAEILTALDPQTVLQRGFSLTFKNGQLVASVADVQPGDTLETRLADGVLKSKVI